MKQALIFFVMLLCCCTSQVSTPKKIAVTPTASPKPAAVPDSTLLQQYQKLVEKEMFGTEADDSLYSIQNAQIFPLKDGRFKIFTYTGEINSAYVSVTNGAVLKVDGSNGKAYLMHLYPVTNIYKLKDNKYLILQSGNEGGGSHRRNCLQATLISLNGNMMTEYKIKATQEENSNQKSLLITEYPDAINEGDAEPSLTIKYDPVKEALTYSYMSSTDINNTRNYHLHKGRYEYMNGTLIHKGEDISKMPWTDAF